MSIRARINLAWWGIWVGLVVVALYAASKLDSSSILFLVPVVVVTLWAKKKVTSFFVRGAFRRLGRLADAGKFDRAHALLAEIHPFYVGSKANLEWLRVQESSILLREHRYGEAATLLESVDRKALSPGWVPFLLNNLAWSLAHTDRAARAILVARESMEASTGAGDRPVTTEDLRGYQLGTLGTSLTLAGQHEDAIPLLEQALARGGRPTAQAARAFYLGEALQGLGRHADARVAWKRASDADPKNDFARRARARLAEPVPAYR